MNLSDRRSLAYGLLIAEHLVVSPAAVLASGRKNLRHLRQVHSDGSANRYLNRWSDLLSGPVESILRVLTSMDEESVELRHTAPFAGVLTEEATIGDPSHPQVGGVKRTDLEHIIRVAGDLLGEEQVIVVGSQSIPASYSEEVLPLEAARSLEADVLPLDDSSGTKADLIEGSLGEFSPFDEQFGVHVDGVSEDTSILPTGWRRRLIAFSNANTNGVTGLCLERHDLCVAKLVANREKDREFVASLPRA